MFRPRPVSSEFAEVEIPVSVKCTGVVGNHGVAHISIVTLTLHNGSRGRPTSAAKIFPKWDDGGRVLP